jgi:hypothetical protein
MAEQADITADDGWFIGEDKTLEFTVLEADGSAQDLSGWAIEWVLRREPGGSALVTKEVGSGITVSTPASGVLQVAVADVDTDPLPAGRYWHALRRADSGTEAVLAYGQVALRAR